MAKYNTYVGMDVHARSITCKGLIVNTGEYISKVFRDCPNPKDIANWFNQLPQPLYCAYESGCTGYYLARQLRKLNINCDIIAISTLPRSTKNVKTKCDKNDAQVILRELVNPISDYSKVWIPDKKTEANRELARAREDAVVDLKKSKQQLLAFLLRNGYVWNQKTENNTLKRKWTNSFWNWLTKIKLNNPYMEYSFSYYIEKIKLNKSKLQAINELIKNEISKPDVKPFIDSFCLLKGVDKNLAFLLYAEFGNFSRFKSGRKVSYWAGLTPTNKSSGETLAHGKITKSGNKYLRKGLMEGLATICCWGSSRKNTNKLSSCLNGKIKYLTQTANERTFSKYNHLTNDLGKHYNKTKVAVASELIRWIWQIGMEVENSIK